MNSGRSAPSVHGRVPGRFRSDRPEPEEDISALEKRGHFYYDWSVATYDGAPTDGSAWEKVTARSMWCAAAARRTRRTVCWLTNTRIGTIDIRVGD